ncbi:MAG: DUF4168 domain-containing protein [Deltaproteobacteria bacterium]|nr:DUF4168 domain-containing protein [Deltaproteobacteria bacterium]
MGKFLSWRFLVGAAIGLLLLGPTPATSAQEPSRQQPAAQQANVTDKDLKAFVKAYVEIQKIRLAYEPSLKNAKGPEESQKIQKEADSKIEKVFKKEGLSVATYNRIFTTVNGSEELRKKTLKLIEEERKKT